MNYLALPVAFFASLSAILVLRPLARKIGLMDSPGGRKTHARDTPLIGGIGVFIGLVSGTLMSPDVMEQYQPLLAICCLLVIAGLVDDYYPLPALARISIQVIAAWLMASWGENQLVTLGQLFSNTELFLGRLVTIMTIFATVGVINAINMIDGMDGLSGGMVLITIALLGFTAGISGNNPALLAFLSLCMACLLAFLTLNFRAPVNKPALIYLGDSGSTMLGFILAWALIESSQGFSERVIPATVALWFLAVPLMDTVYLFIARPLSGKSPFEPGTDHLHHLLASKGFSKTQVVLLLYGVAIVFGIAGLVIWWIPALEKFSVYIFLALFAMYSLLMRRETTAA